MNKMADLVIDRTEGAQRLNLVQQTAIELAKSFVSVGWEPDEIPFISVAMAVDILDYASDPEKFIREAKNYVPERLKRGAENETDGSS